MLRERLGEHATFLGWLHGQDLARAYASADAFLFASRTDTFGQVILEAQASGLPVVAVAEGGPASLIADGETGMLAPPRADALAAALLAVAQTGRRLRSVTGCARRRWRRFRSAPGSPRCASSPRATGRHCCAPPRPARSAPPNTRSPAPAAPPARRRPCAAGRPPSPASSRTPGGRRAGRRSPQAGPPPPGTRHGRWPACWTALAISDLRRTRLRTGKQASAPERTSSPASRAASRLSRS